MNLLNKQKNVITKNEKRIAELEEYIDNMLAKVLEAQPQLLTSGTLLMSERKKPVTPPVCNKDIESFMKRPVMSDGDELPAQNRSYDTFNSVFFWGIVVCSIIFRIHDTKIPKMVQLLYTYFFYNIFILHYETSKKAPWSFRWGT